MQLNPLVLLTSPSGALRIMLIAILAVSVVLLSRFLLVVVLFFYSRGRWSPPSIPRSWALVVFWSGLRGALSLALVLALPVALPGREVLLVSTYAVVLFTLLVQGLSLRFVLARLPHLSEAHPVEPGSPPIPNEALDIRKPRLASIDDEEG
jgi:Na+:H+ antiporter